jgi:hypothetical protein
MNRGSRRATLGLMAFLALLPLAWSAPPSAEGQQIHGENSSFLGQGVAMVWGVLRGASEESTQVILRIVPAGGDYAAVSLDGVDPFTQRRQELLGMQPLGNQLEIRTSRGTFADHPRREIHFFTANDQHAQRPSLTVYFMGLPDTTPEFTSEAALWKYLEETLAKLLAGKGRTP